MAGNNLNVLPAHMSDALGVTKSVNERKDNPQRQPILITLGAAITQ